MGGARGRSVTLAMSQMRPRRSHGLRSYRDRGSRPAVRRPPSSVRAPWCGLWKYRDSRSNFAKTRPINCPYFSVANSGPALTAGSLKWRAAMSLAVR
jgi:hypothetical protein